MAKKPLTKEEIRRGRLPPQKKKTKWPKRARPDLRSYVVPVEMQEQMRIIMEFKSFKSLSEVVRQAIREYTEKVNTEMERYLAKTAR